MAEKKTKAPAKRATSAVKHESPAPALKVRTRKTTVKAAPMATPVLMDEAIAARAYALWQERGCPVGSPEEDWHRAQEQLMAGL